MFALQIDISEYELPYRIQAPPRFHLYCSSQFALLCSHEKHAKELRSNLHWIKNPADNQPQHP